MIAAVYARKSTDDSDRNAEARSTARQIESATRYATAKGWTVLPDLRVKVTGARCPPRRVSVARTRPEPNDQEGWPRTVSSRGLPIPRRLSYGFAPNKSRTASRYFIPFTTSGSR